MFQNVCRVCGKSIEKEVENLLYYERKRLDNLCSGCRERNKEPIVFRSDNVILKIYPHDSTKSQMNEFFKVCRQIVRQQEKKRKNK